VYAAIAVLSIASLLLATASTLDTDAFTGDDFEYLSLPLVNTDPGYALTATVQHFPRPIVHLYCFTVVRIFGSGITAIRLCNMLVYVVALLLFTSVAIKLLDSPWWGFAAGCFALASSAGHAETFYHFSAGATGFTCAALYFRALRLYLSYREGDSKRFPVLLVIVFALALLAKESAITLLPLFILYELLMKAKGDRNWKLAAILTAIAVGYAIWNISTQMALEAPSDNFDRYGLSPMILSNGLSMLGALLAWPFQTGTGPVHLLVAIPVLLVCLAPILSKGDRQQRIMTLTGCWVLVSIIPFTPWFQPVLEGMSRYLLIPSMLFALLVMNSMRFLASKIRKSLVIPVTSILLLALSVFNYVKLRMNASPWMELAAVQRQVESTLMVYWTPGQTLYCGYFGLHPSQVRYYNETIFDNDLVYIDTYPGRVEEGSLYVTGPFDDIKVMVYGHRTWSPL
jgi:4-amino-4-deoxy-L-arabinose transferase-like glycosyltransferase